MTRREILTGSAALLSTLKAQPAPNPYGHRALGGAPTAFTARKPADFLEYCRSLGLGGAELSSGPPVDPDAIRKLHDKLREYDLRVIFNIPLPKSKDDVPRFEASVKAASEVGAYGLHAAMTGRRYEQFKTRDAYQQSFEQNQTAIALAEPILRKHKVRLAIENHKGWRAVEQAAWMQRLSSQYVGVHFDFGNNVSFCEDPMFSLETLKPWICSCHIKDMAVQPYTDGFLLSEVPFGEGFLDLKKMVDTLRQKDPDMAFDLEMITRDPLKIPIYTAQYWATLEETPPHQVAHMMELIQKNPPKKPLPSIAGLDNPARIRAELDYNQACIRYARQNLSL